MFQAGQSSSTLFIGFTANRLTHFETRNNPAVAAIRLDGFLGGGAWQPAKDEPAADFAKLQQAFPTPRHTVEYIMDTFTLVRKADEEKFGTYRTKQRILEVYDQLARDAARG